MKKKYTKKQITEAIAYWEKQLIKLDENLDTTEYSLSELINVLKDALHDNGDIKVKLRSFNDRTPIYDDFYKIETTVDADTGEKILFFA